MIHVNIWIMEVIKAEWRGWLTHSREFSHKLVTCQP